MSIYIVFCPGEKRLLESNHLAIEPGGASADSRDVIAAERLIKDPASYIINMAAYNIMPPKILEERASTALAHLESCRICPRRCQVNRLDDEWGFCRTGRRARVASFAPHFGEEPPLVGRAGSGTIFFSGCNLACVFCQNWDISQMGAGREVEAEEMAKMMLVLQDGGCHNINLVTPTHVVPQILEALLLAREGGLSVPLVYNSGGYDSVETLRLLDGIIDIYMPDAKYGQDGPAQRYSEAPGYTAIMKAALKEMHRQVGDLEMDEEGIALRGLLVRHLVLPAGAAGTEEVVRFISQEISVNTYLNVMAQYRPEYNACRYPELDRPLAAQEYARAIDLAQRAGLVRGITIL
ncbi:MAG: radical SAM protein [Methanothrix sp.]|nr:radical SAM protein [Methanothrix sp.]HPW74058.1 radical SAM protein [Methanothrix sp.]